MAEAKKGKEEKSGRKHLVEIRSEQAHDGSIVHHHTYKKHKTDDHTEPERKNVATSDSPEEAGQHVAEQFGMNDQQPDDPGQQDPSQGGGDPSQGGAPDAGGEAMAGQ